jgi:cysteine-rich repeat protein
MRLFIVLLALSFGACSIIIGNHSLTPCDGAEPRCEGSILVQCAQDIEIKKDCGSDICDPLAAACITICGDGVLSGDEECDDGNQLNTDACKNNCSSNICGDGILFVDVEECDDANEIDADFCKSDCHFNLCGDGAFFPGTEECDDANQNNVDACSNICKLPRCGDQILQGIEECDDGNTSQDDNCLEGCIFNECGDGFVNPNNEECDDQNLSNTDTCLNNCARFSCGDGFVATGQEQCDGTDLNSESCTSLGFVSGSLSCNNTCQFNTSGCNAGANCGNSTVNAGEQCDDGNQNNTDDCLSNCQSARCGDGFVDSNNEDCDDQNTIDTDLCKSDCTFNLCGDGVILSGKEDCDDQNLSTTDACVNCVDARCGDGFVQAALEDCDDQNAVDDDACKTDCSFNVCGDGAVLNGVEQCDDGNNADGDGCQSNCIFPPVSSCGDGALNGAETCDDGNTLPNDGCSATCLFEADLFVLCDNSGQSGTGTLPDPFTTISQALVGANNNPRIMILPQSPAACGGVSINKSVTLLGLADPNAPNAPAAPVIDGGQGSAINANVANTTAIVKNITLQNNSTSSTVSVGGTAKLALLRTTISNSSGLAIDCNSAGGGLFLLNQSVVFNSPDSGLRAKGTCQAVIANSLFQNNGDLQSNTSTVQIQGNNAKVDVVLSTFDGNKTSSANSVMDGCGSNGRGRIDSSIVNQNNVDGLGAFNAIGSTCLTTFTDTFGAITPGNGNINQNPLFVNGFHLGVGSPCINSANPVKLALLFDPLAIFGVDVFGHDFEGNTRPVGSTRDMGMLEAP